MKKVQQNVWQSSHADQDGMSIFTLGERRYMDQSYWRIYKVFVENQQFFFLSLSRKSASVQQRRHRNLSKYLAKVSSDERVVVSNLNRHTSINVDNQPIVHLNFNYEDFNTANHTEAKAKVGGKGSVPSIHPAISVYACLLMLRSKKYQVPQVKIWTIINLDTLK